MRIATSLTIFAAVSLSAATSFADFTGSVACGMGYSAAPSAYCGGQPLPPQAPPEMIRPPAPPAHHYKKPVHHRR